MSRRLLAAFVLLWACSGESGAGPDAMGDVAPDAASDAPDAAMTDADADVAEPLSPAEPAAAPLVQWVDPRIGTGGTAFGVGSASIAPQRPFGLARPGPDTANDSGAPGFNHCAGYHPGDEYIWGFSQVRMHGTGIADYGNIALMPTDGMTAAKTDQRGYRAEFDRDTERSEVGYYAVTLPGEIEVELTASERVAVHAIDFHDALEPTMIIDPSHLIGENEVEAAEVEVDMEASEVRGYSRVSGGYSSRFGGVGVYFVARFDETFSRAGVFEGDTLEEVAETRRVQGTKVGAYVGFDAPRIEVRVGLSFVSVEAAAANLDAENEGFDATRAATVDAWEALLERVRISSRSERETRIFYTALYHVLLMPTLASDADGAYRGVDGEVHRADFRYSTDFSLWDTFRSQTPLLALLYPDLLEDQVRSLLQMAEDGGYAPRWPLGHGYTGGMVGDSATIMIADAFAKGVPLNVDEAYRALRRTAEGPTAPDADFGGRRSIETYIDRGWVAPDEAGWASSATLEFAYADWALARLASAAGEEGEAEQWRLRGGNWRNLWDADRGFLLGRDAAGEFLPRDELDPREWYGFYAEGNANQYAWYAPRDLDGLAEVMGGREALLARLGEFFERSAQGRISTLLPGEFYWHGNEPDIHAPWIFAHFDAPDQTAQWTRWIATELYGDGVDGIPGNDDSGTLSAWYVFAAMGFYPITGESHYLMGAPFFPELTLTLGEHELHIRADDASERIEHVEGVSVDGAVLERSRIEHEVLVGADELRFDLR